MNKNPEPRVTLSEWVLGTVGILMLATAQWTIAALETLASYLPEKRR